ncbi:DUF2560 family protein [Salmonella enterica]|uniref:DUF2560 family protein n=1 Tax=Salmonella enterica TaxID=28901 RepID=UPI003FA7DA80
MAKKILCGGGLMERHRLLQRPFNEWSRQWLINTMAEITALTELQQMNLDILRLVQSDTAAAEKAIAFVAGSKLNFELFKDQLVLAQGEGTALARAEKAIREAKEALDLFTAGA